MKLSKNLGRIATTFLATAMLASVTAVPAFAVEGETITTGTQTNGDYVFAVDKTLIVPENVYAPNVNFTFSIKGATAGDSEVDSENQEVVSGTDEEVTFTSGVAFTSDSQVDTVEGVRAARGQAYFTVHLEQYENPGIYKYELSEVITNPNTNIKYDTTTKWVYVYVINDLTTTDDPDDLKIEAVNVYDLKTKGDVTSTDGKTEGFENEYGKNNEDEPKLHNLSLTKELAGSAAHMRDKFDFTITITNTTSDNQKFTLFKDADNDGVLDENEKSSVQVVTANGSAVTVTDLGHKETVVIIGLRDGDSYTIQETGVTNGQTSDGYTVKNGDNTLNDGSVSGSVNGQDVNVTITNYMQTVAPTGLAMDIAPYALLIVVAAAGCFVFLRKRNED